MKCQRINLRKNGNEFKTLLKDITKDVNQCGDRLHYVPGQEHQYRNLETDL